MQYPCSEHLRYLDDAQDLNFPISLVACVSAISHLDLPIPPGSSQENELDVGSNAVVPPIPIPLTAVSLTESASCFLEHCRIYNWLDVGRYRRAMGLGHSSRPVLGLVGLVIFITDEATHATQPLASQCDLI